MKMHTLCYFGYHTLEQKHYKKETWKAKEEEEEEEETLFGRNIKISKKTWKMMWRTSWRPVSG